MVTTAHDTFSIARPVEPMGYAEWAVVWQASCIVSLEALALDALARLSTEQLRALVVVGITDLGWSRMFDELAARGESL